MLFLARQGWHVPLIPVLGRQRQEDICEFEVSLVYRVSSRTAKATQRNPVSTEKKRYPLPFFPSIRSEYCKLKYRKCRLESLHCRGVRFCKPLIVTTIPFIRVVSTVIFLVTDPSRGYALLICTSKLALCALPRNWKEKPSGHECALGIALRREVGEMPRPMGTQFCLVFHSHSKTFSSDSLGMVTQLLIPAWSTY